MKDAAWQRRKRCLRGNPGYAPLVREAHGGIVLTEPYRDDLWARELTSLAATRERLTEFRRNLAGYADNDSLYGRPRQIAASIADFARDKEDEDT